MTKREVWPIAFGLVDHIDCRTIFDVGAHSGAVAQVFAERFPAATVFAFEPDPDVFSQLSKRLAAIGRGRPFQTALGSERGSASFHVGASRYTSSLFPRNATGRRYFRSDMTMKAQREVKVDTLDGFCSEHGVANIDLLKLDTQGGELAILKGADGLLSRGAVQIIVTEFFFVPHYEGAPLLDEIWRQLRLHNYQMYDIFPGAYASNGQARFGDAIFVSPQFRARILDAMPDEP